ncbi:hypothetical protein ACFL35_01530 [Candidatus Riflebacteria bacterium]
MTQLNQYLKVILFSFLISLPVSSEALKVQHPSSEKAKKAAISYYANIPGFSIPEFKIIGKTYRKQPGHVVILKRVDTSTARVIDEKVAIYHVILEHVEELEFINAFLHEAERNPNSQLYLDIEYALITQLKNEVNAGNKRYLEAFITDLESVDDWSLVHFANILSQLEQYLDFELVQKQHQPRFKEFLKRVRHLINKKGEITPLQNPVPLSQIRSLAVKYYKMVLVDNSEMPEGDEENFTVKILEEEVLESGQIKITLDMFEVETEKSLELKKTYLFEANGNLLRS